MDTPEVCIRYRDESIITLALQRLADDQPCKLSGVASYFIGKPEKLPLESSAQGFKVTK